MSAQETAETAMDVINEAGGFGAFVRDYGLGGILNAFFLAIIGGISDFGDITFGIPAAIGQGMIDLIDELFDGLGDVLGAGAEQTVRGFAEGLFSLPLVSILAQPAALGVVMLSVAVFFYALNRLNISPLSAIQSVRG